MPRLPIFIAACLLTAPCISLAENDWQLVVLDYCLDCHDSATSKGEIDLERVLDAPVEAHPEIWEQVLRQVQARQMPPLDKTRPTESEYSELAEALVKTLDAAATAEPHPGRTNTLRRLTRHEYQNAIRDLLALEIDASTMLPVDSSSHGFDNITVSDLSPALLDRYISAAQSIGQRAVGLPPEQIEGHTIRIQPDKTQEHHLEGLPLGTRGGALVSHVFPQDGTYEFQIRLARDRNEMVEGLQGKHDLEILVDGVPMASLEIAQPKNRRDHTTVDAHLKARIEVQAGPRDLAITFQDKAKPMQESLRQPYESAFNYHRHPRRSPAVYQISITGPFASQGPGDTPSRERIFQSWPASEAEELESARANLSRLLRLAYRRPIEETDLERPLAFFEKGREQSGSYEGGMAQAISAILVSRDFLFRLEKDPPNNSNGKAYAISDLELASRLSFFLWSSIPDEPLLRLAEQGMLQEPATLEAQVRRMLADPRSESLVTNFADQWLYLRNLDSITPDGRLFPDFDDNLRQAFRTESELLFASILREDRSVLDLLRPEQAYLNQRLAKHYGIPHIYGSRFREVSLDSGNERGGLLRHGSILTVTSYATRTSPVIRGNWILENLLGTPPPPPPPNVPVLEENNVAADLPIRERLAAHREQASCASCHNVIDPVGFALEHYDAVGQWRLLDQGNPVDAQGGLPSGASFKGADGLEGALLQQPEAFVRTLTEKLLTFALGRGVEPMDGPAVRGIVRASAESGYRFSDLVVEIAQSVPFTMRQAP